jgi:hypothetical protein
MADVERQRWQSRRDQNQVSGSETAQYGWPSSHDPGCRSAGRGGAIRRAGEFRGQGGEPTVTRARGVLPITFGTRTVSGVPMNAATPSTKSTAIASRTWAYDVSGIHDSPLAHGGRVPRPVRERLEDQVTNHEPGERGHTTLRGPRPARHGARSPLNPPRGPEPRRSATPRPRSRTIRSPEHARQTPGLVRWPTFAMQSGYGRSLYGCAWSGTSRGMRWAGFPSGVPDRR